MPTLDDLSFQFGDNGLPWNVDSVTAPFIDVDNITGLDSGQFRDSEKDTEGVDGGIVEAEFEQIRTIVISGTMFNITGSNLYDYLDSLKANFEPSKVNKPFYIQAPGQELRCIFAKSLGVKYNWTQAMRYGSTPVQAVLKAEDPVIYSADEQIITLFQGASSVLGFGFNHGFDLSFGGASASGLNVFDTGGNRPPNAVIRMPGAGSNPLLVHEDSGKSLQVMVTLASGEYLDINLKARTVTLNGAEDRFGQLSSTSEWFELLSGPNTLRYTMQGNPASEALLTFRPAWR